MSTKPDFDIAIVGGGIAGLCLALSIIGQSSIPVTLYEAAPAFGEIGAGVAFGPNAVRAMSLISKEFGSRFQARATSNLSPEKKTTWFDFRIGMDGKTDEARQRGVRAGQFLCTVDEPEPHSGLINRSHFLDILVDLLPPNFGTFGKILTSLEDNGPAGVLLRFEDGTEATHSAVIGCDGIKSRTRRILAGEDSPKVLPTFTGKYCYRGMIPMHLAVEKLGEELAQNCQAYMGYHGHILTFPVAKGKMMNVVAFHSQDEWRHERMVIPATKEQIFADFKDWGTQVKDIINLMGPSDIWALFDHPSLDTYTRGRLCLMGDAAHASTPFQGAGAGMAVEDAYVLGSLLTSIRSGDQLESAFQAFDALRRERTQRLVTSSRESGQLWHFELEGDDVEKIRDLLASRMRWIWEYDIEADVRAAVATLQQQQE
ncbi:hypothetical protein Z517_03273 [Fonsecaea pedrosoi CBS 271.37]|uniref:FAD-binding domain-containing protein n=1 Tax=Fonsecaea pedrosoi CBS 271.37 TaxID=1442368 RepID=A0A0D2FBP7_9EURO|nr:uncharacterized protein Z517_03273 [Fonsecaea pedrosoi CBS 271.37]KIW84027.1 hypothetical protein Z517_03273 [Fonsecaea pedrosoi CBS 271.37]